MAKTIGSTEGLFGGVQAVETAGHQGIVLDADFLFTAEFVRVGDDLLLRGADGSEILLRDYFAQVPPPPLETAEGARLLPETVEALAVPETPQGYAQAGVPQLAQPIGEVSLLNGTARVQRPDGSRADLHEGDPIFQGDVVSTGVGSELGIVFIDETIFSLSAGSRMIINELIYNPGSTANSMGVSLIQGTFVFITGQVAPSGGMQVETPAGVIGIRGTTVGVEIATLGGRTAIANLTNPDSGETGSFVFSNNAGSALFSLANHYLEIRSANADPGVPRIASSQEIMGTFGRPLSRAVTLQRTLTRDQDQDGETDPTDQQEGTLQGDVLQALQNAGLTPQQIDQFLSTPAIETAAGPNPVQTGDGGTSVPSSGSGFGGSLQTEAVANANNINGSTGGNLGGAASGPLPSSGSAGTSPPRSAGTPADTQDDPPPPPPPPASPPPANTPPNAAPNAADDALATDEDTVVNGNVLADNGNGADSDPDGNPLTVTAVNGSAAAVGGQIVLSSGALLTLNANGSFSYDANGAFDTLGVGDSGTDSFTYTVSDGNGGSDSATVTVTVNGANDAPVVITAPASVAPGNAIFISPSILSAVDPDHGDPADITFTVSDVVDGEIQLAGSAVASFTLADVIAGLVSFVHDGGDNEAAGFAVVASDPLGATSAPMTVTLAVASGFVWTNGEGTGEWNDPDNWLDGAVPVAGSSVTVPNVGPAIFSTGNLVLDSLHLAGGTLQVTGGMLGTGAVDGQGGTLIVNGGEFNLAALSDPTLAVGTGAGSLANAMVQNGGEMSIVGDGALLAVGSENDGNTPIPIFTVSAGGTVLVDGQGGGATVSIGDGAEDFGAIFVDGDGSTLTVDGSFAGIAVGSGGTGELLISDGGLASATYLQVGSFAEGIGIVAVGATDDVPGSRSELRIAGSFPEGGGAFVQIGGAGTGALQVTNGALASIDSAGANPSLVIGASAEGQGTVLVTGVGSELLVTNGGNANNLPFIAVGDEGDGSLIVLDGGQVVNAANGHTFVGLEPGGTGSILVGGDSVQGSLFDAGAVLVIGAGYNFPNDEILFDDGGSGSVTVGAGGTLMVGAAQGDGISDIFIGSGGSLHIEAGGVVVGDIENHGGTLINGNSPGTASFGGDFAMSGGVLEIELGGLEAGAFDLYQVAGAAALNGGTLEFSLIDGYDPVAGDFFAFLTAGGGLGADTSMLSYVFRGVDSSFDFAVGFDGTTAGLTVLNAAGAGDSVIFRGGAGAESFLGGDGADRLDGGGGADTLTGGAGADLFVLRAADAGASLALADIIQDFELGSDVFALADGLTVADIAVGETAAGDAVITLQSSGTYLAVLQGISAAEVNLQEIAALA